MAAKPKAVDWVEVEIDYRAGVLTDRAIGKKHGLSHVAVGKRAKAEGWDRDLSARIKARTEAKVSKAAVTSMVTKEAKLVTERETVEANATLQSDLILKHRKDIQELRRAIAAMSGELGALASADLQAALEMVLDEKTKDVTDARRAALERAYHAAMALGSRAGAGQKLASALGILIDKERQAFGIDKGGDGPQSLGEFLEALK